MNQTARIKAQQKYMKKLNHLQPFHKQEIQLAFDAGFLAASEFFIELRNKELETMQKVESAAKEAQEQENSVTPYSETLVETETE